MYDIKDKRRWLQFYIETDFIRKKACEKFGCGLDTSYRWDKLDKKDIYFKYDKLYTFTKARYLVKYLGFRDIILDKNYKFNISLKNVYDKDKKKKALKMYIELGFNALHTELMLGISRCTIQYWNKSNKKDKYFKDQPECTFKEALYKAKYLGYKDVDVDFKNIWNNV